MPMMRSLFWSLLALLLVPPTVSAQNTGKEGPPVLSLEQVLEKALANSADLRAVDLEIEATEAEIRARDLALSANLQLEASQLRDRRDSTSAAPLATQELLGAKLTKPFTTGTDLTVRAGRDLQTFRGSPSSTEADWEVGLSQDLWRNAFGRGIRLRREADAAELRSKRFELLMKRQSLLQTIENLYWDLAETQNELRIANDNLRRSRQMAAWVQDRRRRAAAEAIDLLQADALVANRQLQLQTLENEQATLRLRLHQLLPDAVTWGEWRTDDKATQTDRRPEALFFGQGSADPRRLDLLAAQAGALAARARAEQATDTSRPSLDLQLAYGRNGIDPDPATAVRETTSENQDHTRIGLVFSMDLDREGANALARAARLRAEAGDRQSARLAEDSRLAWTDLSREIASLRQRLETARKLANLQSQKALEERQRYERGRSTAFQAITFEVEAAEAQLQMIRLQTSLRKAEGRARLFTRQDQE